MPQFKPKLKVTQVRSIRRLYTNGATKAHLARKFGISERQVWNIVNQRVWKHTGQPRKCSVSPTQTPSSTDPAPGGEGLAPSST